jgi:hypothetical protein
MLSRLVPIHFRGLERARDKIQNVLGPFRQKKHDLLTVFFALSSVILNGHLIQKRRDVIATGPNPF